VLLPDRIQTRAPSHSLGKPSIFLYVPIRTVGHMLNRAVWANAQYATEYLGGTFTDESDYHSGTQQLRRCKELCNYFFDCCRLRTATTGKHPCIECFPTASYLYKNSLSH